jgi:hypothetical protein
MASDDPDFERKAADVIGGTREVPARTFVASRVDCRDRPHIKAELRQWQGDSSRGKAKDLDGQREEHSFAD